MSMRERWLPALASRRGSNTINHSFMNSYLYFLLKSFIMVETRSLLRHMIYEHIKRYLHSPMGHISIEQNDTGHYAIAIHNRFLLWRRVAGTSKMWYTTLVITATIMLFMYWQLLNYYTVHWRGSVLSFWLQHSLLRHTPIAWVITVSLNPIIIYDKWMLFSTKATQYSIGTT